MDQLHANLAEGGSTPAASWESWLRMGRSLRLLSVIVIVLLSAGLGLMIYGELRHNPVVVEALDSPMGLLGGFGLLMMLTVGYLIGKQWSMARDQRQVLAQTLEEESMALALRLNPVLDYHHPEICRDILIQQISHAGRLHAPISIMELTAPELRNDILSEDGRGFAAEFSRKIRARCRQTDALLRWSPESFLLALPEVSREELQVVSARLRKDMESCFQDRPEPMDGPALEVRAFTSHGLSGSGDILQETRRLLEQESAEVPVPVSQQNLPIRREKTVPLRLAMTIRGNDGDGASFEEEITTSQVAADRIWFVLEKSLPEKTPLTISAADGSFQLEAVLSRTEDRDGEPVAEVRLTKVPENWVFRQ